MRILCTAIFLLVFISAKSQSPSTAKPWTYWWWMGSAVTRQDITKQMEIFGKSGLGGVHIIPIYGVKGYEKSAIPFLTSEWLVVMEHTVKEGKRLGLGVDLTTGTGWPFGGPNVTQALGAKQMKLVDGQLIIENTKQAVKRAAPGGEGLVLDPFHPQAMLRYLSRFDSAFTTTIQKPRSMYMDSYEAYGANWTGDFLTEFNKRRGYDLLQHLSSLKDTSDENESVLVRIDYHQTLSELLRERYSKPWTNWSRAHGFLTRYQAHGSPANLLDLYDDADIPETESFGTSRFSIPGLRIDPDYSINQFGTPDPLAMKFASSAAHFSGKKLVSSETGTWLANHFKVSLSQIKPQIDELFTAGINHIFYHGTTYSPIAEPYPGWLFYASTNYGPTSHFAPQFPLMNKYVENCQKLLQESKPDNDILLYFPIQDLWATPAKSAGGIHLLEVHHVDRWLLDLPFGKLAGRLLKDGYSFDYVSDSQLERLKVNSDGSLSCGSVSYKTLLIPATTFIPAKTLERLRSLAGAGAKIVFDTKFPDQTTNYASQDAGKKLLGDVLTDFKAKPNIYIGQNLPETFRKNGVVKEDLSSKGLSFIRKKSHNGKVFYFVANLEDKFAEGWIALGDGKINELYDPQLNKSRGLPGRIVDGRSEIFLTLSPGQSCFLLIGEIERNVLRRDNPAKTKSLDGSWSIDFLQGRPHKPATSTLSQLQSWTTLPDSAVYFSGTARYKMNFNAPAELISGKEILLKLGDVRETASVRINGKVIGTAWCIPFDLPIDAGILRSGKNTIEIDVTNLSANYMRLRDKQGPDWKKFYDINIVDITYKKFDASKWEPMPSGLLGPVSFSYK